MLLNDIDFDGAERKICRDCVDKIQGRGKSETLKKVGESTMYGMDKLGEEEEEVEVIVIGGGGDEVSVMPVVYPSGTVIASSLAPFSSVG